MNIANSLNEYKPGLVSVLIPVYNRAEFILQTLNSVYQQTYKNYEIIVVDDGSNDGSYEILENESEAQKIKLFVHENNSNKGQAASLNVALSKAQGEYIAVLDSDDMFEPTKLKAQVDFLKSNQHVGIVYGRGEAVDENNNFLYDISGKFDVDPSDPNEILLDCYFLLPQNSLVRHSIYDLAGGFNESYRAAQDHDMLIRLSEHANIAKINDYVFKYRRHENQISSKGLYTRWTNGFKILEAAQKRYPYKKRTIRKRKGLLHYRMYQVYSASGIHKNKVKALLHLGLAGVLDPKRAIDVMLGQEKG